MAISALNHDVLLDIFHLYRLGNTTNGLDRGWNVERWWFKLIHVCQTWRHLILASPTSLDLHLVCTYGTPVTTMLTHSPPLPLIIYYPGGLGDAAGKEEEDVLFLLQHRERVRRIHIEAPTTSLLGLLGSMDGEYPALQHLVIRSYTEKPSASSRTSVELPTKLQAPLLHHLTLFNVRSPVGSQLLLRAGGLVTFELLDIADSLEAHPAHLVAQLAHMAQLERLVIHFRTALPNRTVERTLSHVVPTRAALPRLKHLSFRGGSAYLEGVLARISAPSLQTLSLNFFAQLTFDLPCLLRFVCAHAEADGAGVQFHAAELHFDAEAACVLLDSRATDPCQARSNPVQLRVSCRVLDWQLAAIVQICGALAPLFGDVERLTLGLHISHPNSDANSSPNVDLDTDRAQWYSLLRAFGGAKTLELAGPRAQHLRRTLLPLPVELLPALQTLLGGNGEQLGGNGELVGGNGELPGGNGELLRSNVELLGGKRELLRGNSGSLIYDPSTFRKHFKNTGRAYREQATTLIEICRLYVEAPLQTYTKDDGLQNVLRLADAALSAAGRAKKGKTSEATDAFLRVREELKRPDCPAPLKDTLGDHRTKLPDPSTALESASKKDGDSMRTLSKVKMTLKTPLPSGHTKEVNFVILESLHERRRDQLIINQEIDNSTTTAEVVWRFSRYPQKTAIHPSQNPHFYLRLSRDAPSFDKKFHKDPLRDFRHRLYHGAIIYALLDKSCRLFLDAAKPRIFGNLWKPHQTVILKDSEDTVLRNIGKSHDYWYRLSVTNSSQHRVGLEYSGADSDIINTPFVDARALIHAAVRAQGIDLMIRDRSRPLPPADSGWKLLPSPEPSIMVQESEDRTTSRQPQLEYSNRYSGAPSIGGSTLFATSVESFRAVANTSEGSPVRTEAGEHPQSCGIDPQVELPTVDTLSIPSPSRELLSVPPVRKRGRRRSWF
ncbi:hypothetical protein EDB92DRAFT_1954296 [Lactarius akahatsu]|uniref:Uncharacterized protein n=1 Tax=Lactarius akahatsu TaxID=416441 RepID=A0AAD4L4P9_9AGAM|nr:hypothetical protein EDB92DRAFT_1954296 [Lactarius akahatsu]